MELVKKGEVLKRSIILIIICFTVLCSCEKEYVYHEYTYTNLIVDGSEKTILGDNDIHAYIVAYWTFMEDYWEMNNNSYCKYPPEDIHKYFTLIDRHGNDISNISYNNKSADERALYRYRCVYIP